MSWSGRRKLLYAGGVLAFLLIVIGIPLAVWLYEAPTCYDGSKNADEAGIDCGGGCALLCAFQANDPVVRWARAFEVRPGVYNAVAYVEHPNLGAGVRNAPYTFLIYDDRNSLILEKKGSASLSPEGPTPIFEANIAVGQRVPARTILRFDGTLAWEKAYGRDELSILRQGLKNPDTTPRVDATVANAAITEARGVEAVAIIYNANGNAIAASRTALPRVAAQSETDIVFTWPYPLTREIEACTAPSDTVLLMDLSGSMDSISVNPPQPLTDAKNAALSYVERLQEGDRVGVVTFASDASLVQPLTGLVESARRALSALVIDPVEQRGFTNMAAGLETARDAFQNAEHERRAAILLTDGLATGPDGTDPAGSARSEAVALKGTGVTLYTIGLGESIDAEFLRGLASEPDHFFAAPTGEDLEGVYAQIGAAICEKGPAVIEIIARSPAQLFGE